MKKVLILTILTLFLPSLVFSAFNGDDDGFHSNAVVTEGSTVCDFDFEDYNNAGDDANYGSFDDPDDTGTVRTPLQFWVSRTSTITVTSTCEYTIYETETCSGATIHTGSNTGGTGTYTVNIAPSNFAGHQGELCLCVKAINDPALGDPTENEECGQIGIAPYITSLNVTESTVNLFQNQTLNYSIDDTNDIERLDWKILRVSDNSTIKSTLRDTNLSGLVQEQQINFSTNPILDTTHKYSALGWRDDSENHTRFSTNSVNLSNEYNITGTLFCEDFTDNLGLGIYNKGEQLNLSGTIDDWNQTDYTVTTGVGYQIQYRVASQETNEFTSTTTDVNSTGGWNRVTTISDSAEATNTFTGTSYDITFQIDADVDSTENMTCTYSGVTDISSLIQLSTTPSVPTADNKYSTNYSIYNYGETANIWGYLFNVRNETYSNQANMTLLVLNSTNATEETVNISTNGSGYFETSYNIVSPDTSTNDKTGSPKHIQITPNNGNSEINSSSNHSVSSLIELDSNTCSASNNNLFNTTYNIYNYGETVNFWGYLCNVRGEPYSSESSLNVLVLNSTNATEENITFSTDSNGFFNETYNTTSPDTATNDFIGSPKHLRITPNDDNSQFDSANGHSLSTLIQLSTNTCSASNNNLYSTNYSIYNYGETVNIEGYLCNVRNESYASQSGMTLKVLSNTNTTEETKTISTNGSGYFETTYTPASPDLATTDYVGSPKHIQVTPNDNNGILNSSSNHSISTLISISDKACNVEINNKFNTTYNIYNYGETVNFWGYLCNVRNESYASQSSLTFKVHADNESVEETISTASTDSNGFFNESYVPDSTDKATNDFIGSPKHLEITSNDDNSIFESDSSFNLSSLLNATIWISKSSSTQTIPTDEIATQFIIAGDSVYAWVKTLGVRGDNISSVTVDTKTVRGATTEETNNGLITKANAWTNRTSFNPVVPAGQRDLVANGTDSSSNFFSVNETIEYIPAYTANRISVPFIRKISGDGIGNNFVSGSVLRIYVDYFVDAQLQDTLNNQSTVTIRNSTNDIMLNATNMTRHSLGKYYYDWDTTGKNPDSYHFLLFGKNLDTVDSYSSAFVIITNETAITSLPVTNNNVSTSSPYVRKISGDGIGNNFKNGSILRIYSDFAVNGTLTNTSETPTITLKNSTDNIVLNSLNMTYLSTGKYYYDWNTTGINQDTYHAITQGNVGNKNTYGNVWFVVTNETPTTESINNNITTINPYIKKLSGDGIGNNFKNGSVLRIYGDYLVNETLTEPLSNLSKLTIRDSTNNIILNEVNMTRDNQGIYYYDWNTQNETQDTYYLLIDGTVGGKRTFGSSWFIITNETAVTSIPQEDERTITPYVKKQSGQGIGNNFVNGSSLRLYSDFLLNGQLTNTSDTPTVTIRNSTNDIILNATNMTFHSTGKYYYDWDTTNVSPDSYLVIYEGDLNSNTTYSSAWFIITNETAVTSIPTTNTTTVSPYIKKISGAGIDNNFKNGSVLRLYTDYFVNGALTDPTNNQSTVTIRNSTNSIIVNSANMTRHSTGKYYYDWNTSGIDPDSYLAIYQSTLSGNLTYGSTWFVLTNESLDSFSERIALATEIGAGAKVKNNLNNSEYFNNENVITKRISETALMKFNITFLKVPDNGDDYKVRYEFYARNGSGEIVESIETTVQGTTGNKDIYFGSNNLSPNGLQETYLVKTIVSMQNENGLYLEFNETIIGSITVDSSNSVTEGDTVGRAGLYDVIVEVDRHKYEPSDIVKAEIVIFNTGDIPDEDTVLIYWLEKNGERYGEVKEQFLEIPVGKTFLNKAIALPSDSELGEWRFVAEYYTVVQPKIKVYDSFEVVEDVALLDDFQEELKNLVLIPATFITDSIPEFVKSQRLVSRDFVYVCIGILFSICLFIFFVKRRKRK